MKRPPRSHQVAPDAPEYVEAWARDIVHDVGKREARELLSHYRALSENTRLAKSDRETAAERADALAKLM